jgi:hypothetical protein
VESGKILGIFYPLERKGDVKICSKFGRLLGSRIKIEVIRALEGSEIGTCSGNE